MLSGGDEVGRTQRGNNNGYCHDSELTWTPWDVGADDAAFRGFVERLVALRAGQPVLRRRTFLTGRDDVRWLCPDGRDMTGEHWADGTRRALGVYLDGRAIAETDAQGRPVVGDTLLVLLNAGDRDQPFILPSRGASAWTLLVDTARPDEIGTPAAAGGTWRLTARSAAVLRAVPVA
jgi:glycogen operon protein